MMSKNEIGRTEAYMFDLNELKSYREGNRLEAKKALGRDGQGELPRSAWETVSAFANTAGGVIVLGVSERRDDGSFVVHGIPKAEKVLDDFWNAALSEDKLPARFMKDADATVETVEGKDIVVTRVPWVDRYTRPVYIDNSIFGGTFRRTHTGDHQCKREEVLSMLRDSDTSSQDAAIAESARVEFINRETVAAYRRRFDQRNEGHVWGKADDETFLTDIGALRVNENGELRPTRAGLLMFGEDRWITYEFPHYFLDYRQETGHDTRWEDRFTSQPGDWTGNVYDFYFRVYNKLRAALKVPFRLDGVDRVDDTPAHEALREAIVNALTNANWFDRRGVVCVWDDEAITIANPGDFRMPVEEARKPGSTDPRNETMMRMFAMVEIGERAGSGMDKIFGGWAWAGYAEPGYEVAYGPDRTTLTLPLASTGDRTRKAVDSSGRFRTEATETARAAILALFPDRRTALKSAEVAGRIGLGKTRTNELLRGLVGDGLIVAEGSARNRVYRRAEQ